MTQDGDRVVGKFTYGNGDGFARGTWQDGRLILVLTPTRLHRLGHMRSAQAPRHPGAGHGCPHRLARFGSHLHSSYNGGMSRSSPSCGAAIEYPYEAELKNCGQLATYELAFETNSDKLKGTDWPILQALADLMKKDSTLKIEVASHTDSTGNATTNQTLSEKRAHTVKKTLTDKYGVDASRPMAKGDGSDQPLADNGSEQGRAINRRVELVKQ